MGNRLRRDAQIDAPHKNVSNANEFGGEESRR